MEATTSHHSTPRRLLKPCPAATRPSSQSRAWLALAAAPAMQGVGTS
uniref:Uncharacterized protein n=1 Tax=Zea mays TaxID=4577 RepID=C4J8C1_MAIZE|nr:unknown [Zea mays]